MRKKKRIKQPASRPSKQGLTFSVDTHIFRELGDLLVGRDSTALAELIKNAYDADARKVTVSGAHLDDADHGEIVITDDGHGMTKDEFVNGFLRIAGRQKEGGDKRSPRFKRRFTGEKGIGRLAAHKLARNLTIRSISTDGQSTVATDAKIDWDEIERFQTLTDATQSGAIQVTNESIEKRAQTGTTIHLSLLRRKWTNSQRSNLYQELSAISPPDILMQPPKEIFDRQRLVRTIPWRDSKKKDDQFEIVYSGDFDAGDTYYKEFENQLSWLIEIDGSSSALQVQYQITPSRAAVAKYPTSRPRTYKEKVPPGAHPSFAAHIVVREGAAKSLAAAQDFMSRTYGVRVFVEGFRVLPYGDRGNDWLNTDEEYVRRERGRSIEVNGETMSFSGLLLPSGRNVFGAVFMTQASSRPLRMLVNREGFVPDDSYNYLVQRVKQGIYLCTRDREVASATEREERRFERMSGRINKVSEAALKIPDAARRSVQLRVELSAELLKAAEDRLAKGLLKEAKEALERSVEELNGASDIAANLLPEVETLRMMAGIGLQMNAFVHEIKAVHQTAVGIAESVDDFVEDTVGLSPTVRRFVKQIQNRMQQLTRALERNASYLADVLSADARRRRSKQYIAKRVRSAIDLFTPSIEKLGIEISIHVDNELQTPPMFAAELSIILTNLLSNAIKAAGKRGHLRIAARELDNLVEVRIENSGVAVDLDDAERWFKPFESSIESPDPLLGQGMGLGLPITRDLVESYGGEVSFVAPSKRYKTALMVKLPKGR